MRRRDFRVLSWLLPSLKKQKGWMKVAIFLHFSISNKNLLQPPACLQDFLSCLTTSIFKLAQFLSVRIITAIVTPAPVLPCSRLWITFTHALWSCCYYITSDGVFLQFLHNTCCMEATGIREQSQKCISILPACLQAAEHTEF